MIWSIYFFASILGAVFVFLYPFSIAKHFNKKQNTDAMNKLVKLRNELMEAYKKKDLVTIMQKAQEFQKLLPEVQKQTFKRIIFMSIIPAILLILFALVFNFISFPKPVTYSFDPGGYYIAHFIGLQNTYLSVYQGKEFLGIYPLNNNELVLPTSVTNLTQLHYNNIAFGLGNFYLTPLQAFQYSILVITIGLLIYNLPKLIKAYKQLKESMKMLR
jgi:uncharacterized membrane protein (DUF106 family)